MVERWDACGAGCGQLIFNLRKRLMALPPGATLEVTTHDAGAPADLPAWCRTTGHVLVSAEHPVYAIRRKDG
jgi:tRNA 2-thiouridine synthesizing protein A